MPKYLVEGAYNYGNDGSPVTGDYVVAENERAAKQMVTDIRTGTDEWTADRAITFENYITEMRGLICKLEAMTEDEVTDSWLETCANLGADAEDTDEDPV